VPRSIRRRQSMSPAIHVLREVRGELATKALRNGNSGGVGGAGTLNSSPPRRPRPTAPCTCCFEANAALCSPRSHATSPNLSLTAFDPSKTRYTYVKCALCHYWQEIACSTAVTHNTGIPAVRQDPHADDVPEYRRGAGSGIRPASAVWRETSSPFAMSASRK
jgi:hypothetical protein